MDKLATIRLRVWCRGGPDRIGRVTIDGDGTQTRDFVHVDDVVQANLLAAMTAAVSEAYNIGTGTETSVLDLAETV